MPTDDKDDAERQTGDGEEQPPLLPPDEQPPKPFDVNTVGGDGDVPVAEVSRRERVACGING